MQRRSWWGLSLYLILATACPFEPEVVGVSDVGPGGDSAVVVDAGQSDTALQDGGRVDSSQPDAATLDSAAPDITAPDGATPDAAAPDAAVPDAALPDTSTPDTGTSSAVSLGQLRSMVDGAVDVVVADLYVTYLRATGYYLQEAQLGPAIWVFIDPALHGVQVGNKVSLHVNEIGTYNALRQIESASVLSNDHGSYDVATHLVQDLSAGAGVLPGEELESELVRLTDAMKISGARGKVLVRYGDDGVIGSLEVFDTLSLDLCQGAVFDLDTGYVFQDELPSGASDYYIRSHYDADLSNIDTALCAAPDDSNWGFESWGFIDPIDDFVEDNSSKFTIEPESTLVHGGTASAKVTWSDLSTDEPELFTAYRTPTSEGVSTTCRLWIYDADADGRARLFLSWWDATGETKVGASQFSQTYTEDAAAWTEYSIAGVAPAGAAGVTCGVRFYQVDNMVVDGEATLFIDDLSIE